MNGPSVVILREPEVGRRTGLSRSTRWRLERVGKFPRRRQLGENSVGWVEAEVDSWLREREAANPLATA